MLQITDLTVFYDQRLALNDFSLSLDKGQILVVIGPNGAGKTTLIRALSGVVPVKSGKITLDDIDITSLSPNLRARQLAVVPQARSLPPAFTAWETVVLGRTPYLNFLGQVSTKDEEIVRSAMKVTDTLELAERRVGELSGGEQQRLMLARALAQQAPILLLDEPVTHLDLHYQFGLLDQIKDLVSKEKFSVIAVLHDLNMAARYANQIALLVNGGIQGFGNPEEVLTAEILSEAFDLPLEVLQTGKSGKPFITPAILM
jgi:iron complex transport system ATP-binding protein